MTTTTPNKPIEHVRLGAVRVAIWRNEDSSGKSHYNTTPERIYRDSEGNWQSTDSFRRDDLLTLGKVADIAHTKIHALQAAERAKEAVEENSNAAAVGASAPATSDRKPAKAR